MAIGMETLIGSGLGALGGGVTGYFSAKKDSSKSDKIKRALLGSGLGLVGGAIAGSEAHRALYTRERKKIMEKELENIPELKKLREAIEREKKIKGKDKIKRVDEKMNAYFKARRKYRDGINDRLINISEKNRKNKAFLWGKDVYRE